MNKQNNKKQFKMSTVFLLLLLIICVLFIFTDTGNKGEYISIDTAYSYVDKNQIDDVYSSGTEVRIRMVNSNIDAKNFPNSADYYFESTETQISAFIDYIIATNKTNSDYNTANPSAEQKIVVTVVQEPAGVSWLDYLMPLIYLGLGIVAIIVIFKMISGSNKSSMNFGKSRAKATTNVKVRFNDVAGADEEKEELAEIVEFLRNPQKFTDLGARIPKGVLLVGNPGTGKTLLARAVAGESNVPFLTITGSDFVEMFVGVGAARVRDLFEQAKKLAPCIVFIDEIDAVGRQRGTGLGGGNDEREQTLNQLLVEMDGFEANEGIIILAATNRSDVLDPALLRPGRFDRQIYVHVPDVVGREGILKIHARNKPLFSDVDFKLLARMTSGFTGADLENMLNEAAILAARNNRPKIIMADILEGINKVIMGPQKKSRLVTERDKKITAYHESGHAILGKLLPNCEPVQEVSIIPRGMAAGYTMSRPDTDDNHVTYNKLNDQIAMTMGGRIAEEIMIGDISTGASNDIQKATEIARKMVTEWGMSKKLGFTNFASDSQVFIGRDYQTKINYSEKTAGEIDDEISSILKYNYDRAKKLLSDNKNLLEEMTKLLLLKETIFTEEVNSIMEGVSSEEIAKKMEEHEEARKIEEEKHRKEFEILRKLKEIELKIKTGEMYFKNGIITESDLRILKAEKLKIEKELLAEQAKNVKVENKDTLEEKIEDVQEKQEVEDKPENKTKKTTERKTTKKSNKKEEE